ncbi:hypothetical protein BGZ50_006793, partial [Haplosporangium sp. Z 11]
MSMIVSPRNNLDAIRDGYECVCLFAFFSLMIQYLGDDTVSRRAKITGPERRKLLSPLNCFYYNPMSDMFLHYMKYGILQYVVVKPLCTIAALVSQHYGFYCETVYDFHFAMIYITIVNFISASVALYCLILKPENHWSAIDVQVGITSLLICTEMVVFSILHVYAFTYRPYVVPGVSTPIYKSLIDGFNPIDLLREIIWAFHDIGLLIRGKPVPIRDGHLSGRLERAQTIRIRKRDRFFKNRRPAAPKTPAVDPVAAALYNSVLDSEGGNRPSDQEDHVRTALLDNTD